jgi:hypothetical protein
MVRKDIMSLFDWFRKPQKKKRTTVQNTEEPVKSPPPAPVKTEKQLATERGEPWVAILSMDIDPENLHQGAFELDWNSVFVTRLVRAGYMIKKEDTDAEMVDRWFQNVCRHVVMETWEQEQAMNPQRHIKSKDLGDGRREVS